MFHFLKSNNTISDKVIIFLIIFFYLSLIIGFFLNEDLNGGAHPDFNSYINLIKEFQNNFNNVLLNYSEYNERHSPVLIIILSFLNNIGLDIKVIRVLNLHINLLIPFFFYQCLKIKFSKIDKNFLKLISLVIFLSTTYRSLSIWPDSRIYGLLFFLISLKFFLQFNKNKSLYYSFSNIFFLSISSYFSPNFSLFAIYFFFFFFKEYGFSSSIYKIIFLNILLSLPALYYIFYLQNFFFLSGVTPGSSMSISTLNNELNIFNKIILILSIFFFYFIPFLGIKTKVQLGKTNMSIIYTIIIIILYFFSIYFFDYKREFTGGGIFFHISQIIFDNNYFIFLIAAIAFYYLLVKNMNFNNICLFLILIFSNPQLTIYHKYYDPLIIILILTIFNFGIKESYFKLKNIIFIYTIFLFFLFSKIIQSNFIS